MNNIDRIHKEIKLLVKNNKITSQEELIGIYAVKFLMGRISIEIESIDALKTYMKGKITDDLHSILFKKLDKNAFKWYQDQILGRLDILMASCDDKASLKDVIFHITSTGLALSNSRTQEKSNDNEEDIVLSSKVTAKDARVFVLHNGIFTKKQREDEAYIKKEYSKFNRFVYAGAGFLLLALGTLPVFVPMGSVGIIVGVLSVLYGGFALGASYNEHKKLETLLETKPEESTDPVTMGYHGRSRTPLERCRKETFNFLSSMCTKHNPVFDVLSKEEQRKLHMLTQVTIDHSYEMLEKTVEKSKEEKTDYWQNFVLKANDKAEIFASAFF